MLIARSCLLGGNPSDVYEEEDNVVKPKNTPTDTQIPYSVVYSYDFKTQKWQLMPEDGGRYYPSINGYVVRKDFRRLVLEVPGKPDEILLEDPEKKELWLTAWDYNPSTKALVWIPKDSPNVVYYCDPQKSWPSSVIGYGAGAVAFSPRGQVWVSATTNSLFDMRSGGIAELDEYGRFVGWRCNRSSGISSTGVALELSEGEEKRVREAFRILSTKVPPPRY
jgi:hypothetical protein